MGACVRRPPQWRGSEQGGGHRRGLPKAHRPAGSEGAATACPRGALSWEPLVHAGTRCCALAVCGRGRCSSLRLILAAAGTWAGEYCVSPGLWGAGGRPEGPTVGAVPWVHRASPACIPDPPNGAYCPRGLVPGHSQALPGRVLAGAGVPSQKNHLVPAKPRVPRPTVGPLQVRCGCGDLGVGEPLPRDGLGVHDARPPHRPPEGCVCAQPSVGGRNLEPRKGRGKPWRVLGEQGICLIPGPRVLKPKPWSPS